MVGRLLRIELIIGNYNIIYIKSMKLHFVVFNTLTLQLQTWLR